MHSTSLSSSSSFTFPYNSESPFNSRDRLLAEHSPSSTHTPNSSSSLGVDVDTDIEEGNSTTATATATGSSTEMAWFTIRNDNWTNLGGGFNAHRGSRPSLARKMSRTRRVKLFRSYAFDWLICIVLAAVFFSLDEIPGFKRQFSIHDTRYAVLERVPPVALYFIAAVAPFVIQIAVNLLTIRSLWDFHNSSLGLLLGLTLTGAITQFTKVTVGRPRPDVISRCQPPPGIENPEYGLVTVGICTQTDVHIIRDGFRSFPSGHSSLSFAGLGFLSFYLAGKMHLFDEKGHTTKAWISLTPLSGAALVAISRTMDYRHHWQDVLVGSLLGLVMSFFAYRQYYPPLGSPRSHRPFSPRIRREGSDAVDGGGGDLEDNSPSEESHAPILPIHRPGVGRKNMGGPSGGRGEEDGGVVNHPTVPHVHLLHGGHPNHSSESGVGGVGGYMQPRYQEEQIEDLQRGSANSLNSFAPNVNVVDVGGARNGSADGPGLGRSVSEEALEMNSPLRGAGMGSRG
ncbi:hypothetical protein ACEPAG_5682 [Sanghuangporus baumii]